MASRPERKTRRTDRRQQVEASSTESELPLPLRHWYECKDGDTPFLVARGLRVCAKTLVALNKVTFPDLRLHSKLRAGTWLIAREATRDEEAGSGSSSGMDLEREEPDNNIADEESMLNEVAEILSNVKMILSQEDILSDKHDPSVQLKNLQHKLSAASELLNRAEFNKAQSCMQVCGNTNTLAPCFQLTLHRALVLTLGSD